MTKYKRGHVREDGKVFWQYSDRYKSKCIWITSAQYKKYTFIDNRPKERPLKCGDTREDDKIFWCYAALAPNGEWWITESKYKEKMEKSKIRDRERYAVRSKSDAYRKYQREHHKERAKTDINYRIAHNIRGRLSAALSRYSKKKKASHVKDLGCTFSFLVKYIETRFVDGMSWDNYGDSWSIDHVKPMASFNLAKKSEQKKACHYTNLQPMFSLENIAKGAKELKQQKL